MTQPIPDLNLHLPTALILIDNQSAFTHPDTLSHWGTARSNPHYEENLQSLVSSFRAAKAQAQALEAATSPSASTSEPKSVEKQAPTLEIIHIFHSSDSPTSPLHHAHPLNGIQPLAFAAPATDGTEPIFWKNVNSAFIGTTLEAYLRARDIRQIVCAGLTTDHCVSTTVRMAANLGVVDRPRSVGNGRVRFRSDGSRENEVSVDKGRVILAADATATFGKGGFDAETVHRVSVASLEGEFADVMDTEAIVQALNRVGGGKASIVDD